MINDVHGKNILGDRTSYLGCSDLNALCNRSKFTTPTELLIGKLPEEKRRELELNHESFNPNIYAEIGNIFETKIQKCLGLVGDQESYETKVDGFRFVGHLDGRSDEEDWQLFEIKVTSAKHQKGGKYIEMTNEEYIDKLSNEYYYQLQGQMLLTGKSSNILTALPRRGLMAEITRDILTEFNLPNLHNLDDEDFAEEVFVRTRELFENYVVEKEDIIMLEVKRDENAIQEIETKMKILIKYINELKECDCMFKAIDIISKFEKEIQGGDNVALEVSNISDKILDLEKQLIEAKKVEKQIASEKTKLKKFFKDNELSKYETPNGVKISLGKDTCKTEEKPTELLTKEFVEELLNMARMETHEDDVPMLFTLNKPLHEVEIEDLFETKETKRSGVFKVTIPPTLLLEKKESKTELPV